MKSGVEKYLERRADLTTRPLVCPSGDNDSPCVPADGPCVFAARGVEQVVVIPVLAERRYLFETLESLCGNPASELERTLVICVVNNRGPAHVEPQLIEDNQETLAILRELIAKSYPPAANPPPDSERLCRIQNSALRLAFVDASSPGLELPPKDGVGLARKIGLDWGLAVLRDAGAVPGILISLDADTHVEPNYLAAVRDSLTRHNAWASVVAYAHRNEASEAAIVCYELYLRYHVLGLRFAGSPYAFASIGSTIACRADAYVAASGMNRRQAGEDFYFLQQLAKTGRVDSVSTTTVYPSARPSGRVPFGTGARVRRFVDGGRDEYVLYHPRSYCILKDWLALVSGQLGAPAAQVLDQAGDVSAPLRAFLESNDFPRVWQRLVADNRDPERLRRQFHGWFDGFRTLKLIHYLREHGYPDQEMFGSIATLLEWLGKTPPDVKGEILRSDLEAQGALLGHLRREQ